jgi:hypothetical protein
MKKAKLNAQTAEVQEWSNNGRLSSLQRPKRADPPLQPYSRTSFGIFQAQARMNKPLTLMHDHHFSTRLGIPFADPNLNKAGFNF